MKYIVLGLGNFGTALSLQLTTQGHEVIAVDKNMVKVDRIKDRITHAVCLDTTDADAMSALPLKDADAVIIAIGEEEGASILTTALVKNMKAKRIIGRVMTDLQKSVLEAMDIKEYIMPEEDAADRLALTLNHFGIVDSFKISEQYSIIETKVPKRYVGMTLKEANLTNRYQVIVLTTISSQEDQKIASGLATSETVLRENEILVLFGEINSINKLILQGE